MRILTLIPARGGSKRLPGKNIRPLGGKPLIEWTIEVAKQISNVVEIIVSTDDSAIGEVASNAGACVPWLRPLHLATDEASVYDVCIHALDYYEARSGKVDGFLLLQPTSPFRRVETLRAAVALFQENPLTSVVAVTPARDSPYWCFHIDEGILKPVMGERFLRQRSQELPPAYAVSGSIYLVSPTALRLGKSLFSDSTRAVVLTSAKEAVDIDTFDDWTLAEFLLNKPY